MLLIIFFKGHTLTLKQVGNKSTTRQSASFGDIDTSEQCMVVLERCDSPTERPQTQPTVSQLPPLPWYPRNVTYTRNRDFMDILK